ncbi:MAG: HAMP domain-containing histidine kinase [Muribaculaceae bacterium]
MASKRRISYQWQLFIPLVATLWIIIAGMTFWQFYNEREYRKAQISEQLSLVASLIVAANERDFDATPFMDFATNYYRENPLYDLLRITVYKDGRMIRCYGEPIALTDSEQALEQGVTNVPGAKPEPASSPDAGKYFYYSVKKSDDGRVTVYTVLPFDNDILNASLPSTRIFWVMFVIALIVTILAYYSTRYFGRNISNLRTVAERASTDPNFIPAMDYPHDELGDISRQIISMYNQRSQAMQRQKKEHAVALHAIEEKAKSKRQLTNNINHELRTPIGVIKGYIDTILENPDMDEASRTHFLRKASEHVDRLVNLIADVSAITRLEEGGELISTEELDFHDIAYTIANDLEESGALGKMTFRYDIPLDCKIMGNYNLLSGMILNLAKNSGTYSKGTYCELVLTGEDEKFYHFEFRDDGVGVGEEHIPHLFDRFYRVDSGRTRKAGGTGLGLPIVQNTILAHGGTIEVCNGELGGLCFKFSLPKVRTRQ